MKPTPSSVQPSTAPLRGRLNTFQRTMLDWNDLHPYNAVHVVHFAPLPDLSRLRQAIQTTLAFHGLTRLTLGGKRRTFTYAGGQTSCELTVLEGDNPQELLRAEIERQINTPFDCHGAFEPFRFFVVRDGAGCYLGLVYFHAVADAVSIVRLLRHIHGTLTGNSPSSETPVRLLRDRSRLQPWSLLRKLKAFAGKLWHHRHSVRVAHRDVFDGRNRYEMLSLDAS
ncbi:MAG: hypothetical protein U1F65_08735, partial [Verrucomicrobiota bacterium]